MGYDPGHGIGQRLIDINRGFSFIYEGIDKLMGQEGMGTVMTAVMPQGCW